MKIFVFSSKNLTNIWAGIGARLWAVSCSNDSSTVKGRKTKAEQMRIGSFGLLYCTATQALTTPFIVYSRPNPDFIVENIWPEAWMLPFRIFPLGTPERQLLSKEAKNILPIFKNSGESNFGRVFYVQAVTAFSPTKIGSDDWEILIERLAVYPFNIAIGFSHHRRARNLFMKRKSTFF